MGHSEKPVSLPTHSSPAGIAVASHFHLDIVHYIFSPPVILISLYIHKAKRYKVAPIQNRTQQQTKKRVIRVFQG